MQTERCESIKTVMKVCRRCEWIWSDNIQLTISKMFRFFNWIKFLYRTIKPVLSIQANPIFSISLISNTPLMSKWFATPEFSSLYFKVIQPCLCRTRLSRRLGFVEVIFYSRDAVFYYFSTAYVEVKICVEKKKGPPCTCKISITFALSAKILAHLMINKSIYLQFIEQYPLIGFN